MTCLKSLSQVRQDLNGSGAGFIGTYCTVIDPRLAGRPVGVPPELTVTVCTAWVEVPVTPVVMSPHPSSVAADRELDRLYARTVVSPSWGSRLTRKIGRLVAAR